MDRIGTIMGLVTIPMALLTLASVAGAAWLLAAGLAPPVLLGVAALGAGLALAGVLERVVSWLDEAALAARGRFGAAAGRAVALVCGTAPMLVVLAWEAASLILVTGTVPRSLALAAWLCSYGVATGPWTIFALIVGSDRRTLAGIRAYAGHLAYWLLTAAAFGGAPASVAFALMALPAALPVTVGTLLAIADRDALRNVRI